MRTHVLFLLTLCALVGTHAASYTSQTCDSTDWSDTACWVGGTVPPIGSDVTIASDIILNSKVSYAWNNFPFGPSMGVNMSSLTVSNNATLHVTSNATLVAGSGGIMVEAGSTLDVNTLSVYAPACVVVTTGNLTVHGTMRLLSAVLASTGSAQAGIYGLFNASGVNGGFTLDESFFAISATVYEGGWLHFFDKVHLAFWWFPGTRQVTVADGGRLGISGPQVPYYPKPGHRFQRSFTKVQEISLLCTETFYEEVCKKKVSPIVVESGGKAFVDSVVQFWAEFMVYGDLYVWRELGIGYQFYGGGPSTEKGGYVGSVGQQGYESPYTFSYYADGGAVHALHAPSYLPVADPKLAPAPYTKCEDVPFLLNGESATIGVSAMTTSFDCRHMELIGSTLHITGAGEIVISTELILTRSTLVIGDDVDVEFTNAVVASDAHIYIGANSTVTFRASKMTNMDGYVYYGGMDNPLSSRVDKEKYPHPLTFSSVTVSGPGTAVFLHEVLVTDRMNIAANVFFEGEAGEPLVAGDGYVTVWSSGSLSLGIDASFSAAGLDVFGELAVPAGYTVAIDAPVRLNEGSTAAFAGEVTFKANGGLEECGGVTSGLKQQTGRVAYIECGATKFTFDSDAEWDSLVVHEF